VQRMKGDWLMFIDDDMVWDADSVGKLLAARDEIDADIIGGLCYRRSAPHQPTLFMRETATSGGYNYMESWDDDIVEVDATGMAFVIIHKRVFEAIAGTEMPSIEVRESLGPAGFFQWSGTLGEDLRFCQEAKAAGMRIFVDTRIEVGHIAEVEIRKKQFLVEHLGRNEEKYLARKEVNDRMGLPTLTPAQIKEQLGW
jgi:GT2 family glycosyltransferase